ncbi:hypothetical protein Tco_0111718 [Tanacetum coccineum]
MTKSYCPLKQSEVFPVISTSNELFKASHQPSIQQLMINILYHDARPFLVQVTSSPSWHDTCITHLQIVGHVFESITERYECTMISDSSLVRNSAKGGEDVGGASSGSFGHQVEGLSISYWITMDVFENRTQVHNDITFEVEESVLNKEDQHILDVM